MNAAPCGLGGASGGTTSLGKSGLPTASGSVGGLLNSSTGLTSSGLSGAGPTSGSGTGGGVSGGGGVGGGFGGTSTGLISSMPSLHEDVLGAHLKSGLAQYVSLELSRSCSVNDQDVLPMLAPGLLVDIKPVKSTGFTSSGAPLRLRPPIIQTNNVGSSPGSVHHSSSIGAGEYSTGKQNRSSGSTVSRQSDDSATDRSSRGPADATVILITPSTESGSVTGITMENPMTRMPTLHGSTSTSGSGSTSRVQSPVSPTVAVHPPTLTSSEASPITGTTLAASSSTTPGAPGAGISRLTTTYGHVTLAPTFSQTSQIDAPILHHLSWLKCIPPSSQLG